MKIHFNMTKDSKNFQSYVRALNKAKLAGKRIIFLLNNQNIRNRKRRLRKWSVEQYKWQIWMIKLDDGS